MRTKGSKNKPKIEAGNPAFNLTSVTPSNTIGHAIAPGAIMPEDLEFERQLEQMNSEMPPPIDDPDPASVTVKAEKPKREMLADAIENYKPASTDDEFRNQLHEAKYHGCDSIEVTEKIGIRYCRDPQLKTVGYFMFHDVKCYLEGAWEKATSRDKQTIQQRVFGNT